MREINEKNYWKLKTAGWALDHRHWTEEDGNAMPYPVDG